MIRRERTLKNNEEAIRALRELIERMEPEDIVLRDVAQACNQPIARLRYAYGDMSGMLDSLVSIEVEILLREGRAKRGDVRFPFPSEFPRSRWYAFSRILQDKKLRMSLVQKLEKPMLLYTTWALGAFALDFHRDSPALRSITHGLAKYFKDPEALAKWTQVVWPEEGNSE